MDFRIIHLPPVFDHGEGKILAYGEENPIETLFVVARFRDCEDVTWPCSDDKATRVALFNAASVIGPCVLVVNISWTVHHADAEPGGSILNTAKQRAFNIYLFTVALHYNLYQ